jgi:hypothetical protein
MTYQPLLPGIAIEGYRSFGSWQTFEFPSKITVLAGINNSGKSNVLRFLQEMLPKLRSSHGQRPALLQIEGLDRPRGFSGQQRLRIGLPIDVPSLETQKDPRFNNGQIHPHELSDYQQAAMSLLSVNGVFWSTLELRGDMWSPPGEQVEEVMGRWPNWAAHSQDVLRALGGGSTNPTHIMAELLIRTGAFTRLPAVVTINSARRVEFTQDDGHVDWLSGRGMIKRLAALQNPSHEQEEWTEGRKRWAEINQFIQTVLGDVDASINIPHDYSTIQVETPDRVLPLSSLGSGIEQVIVLAAAATVTVNHLVCIEEPETNLHPLLQKKLIRYLTDNTDNQYVIATHSSHLLDDSRASAYHLRLTQKGTVVRRARRPHELVEICNDLGYRPSDLMQANCVIWVEGPSDRIYVRHWLHLVKPDLAEGIDYSIMFYGGKLLAHLTIDDDALADFIDLRQLNRASVILIDSDKESAHARVSSTKRRIRDEFEKSGSAPGFAWITKCYTIENYVPDALLVDAVRTVHPNRALDRTSQWTNPLKTIKGQTPFDKIAIAREVEQRQILADIDRYDLKRRINDLAQFIATANGKTVAPMGLG